jgi:hypothetical protein
VTLRKDAIEDDGDVWEEFRDDIESAYVGNVKIWYPGAEGILEICNLPHTVHKINSISASGSRASFKLIAIADCPIMMVPM